jgi:hypothetical protein
MSMDNETVYFPDQLEKSAREALGQVGADNISRYLGLGFSPDEILAVALYTTAASYVMNAILRGQVENESLIRIFSPWIDKTAEALAKLPEGAKNAQTGSKIDDNLGDDDWVSFDEVYRVDKWDGAFPQAALGWKQGGTIREDAFLSTAIKPGIYSLGRDDVSRTIRNASAAKSVRDLSEIDGENEALLPPGSTMRIDAIRERATQTDVKDMKAEYGDVDTLTAQKFDVETTLVDGKGQPIQENATTSDGDPVLPAGPLEAKVASKKDPLAV